MSKVSKFGMINLILIIFLSSFSSLFGQSKTKEYIFWNYIDSILTYHCKDVYGSALKKNTQLSNALKNRNETSSQITKIDIESFYNNKNDLNSYSIHTFGEITGRVIRVKISKAESCNCNNKDYRMRDIHIAIIPKDSPKSTLPIIVEITPRIKMKMAEENRKILDHNLLKKELLGKIITFQGWMFFDAEHFENSKNTAIKDNAHIWRQTAWEIHPVINFFVNN